MWALWRTGRRGRELDKAGVARRRSRPKRRRETMTVNRASARYEGLGKDGRGYIWTGRGALDGEPYGFASRFEDGPGTNPEELIAAAHRSEEHTSELQSLMRISYAVFCLKKKKNNTQKHVSNRNS